MNFTILSLNHFSYQDWQTLWQGYQDFYQVQLSEAVCQNTWKKLIDPKYAPMYGFAAMIDDRMVAIVHVIEHDSCWTSKPYAYLQDLFVLPNQRGKGIAKALITHVQQYTQERQCDRVYWLTHQDNEVAQQVYDQIARKTGFIQYRM